MKKWAIPTITAATVALASAGAFAALGGTGSGGNTEIIAWSNYNHVPSGQSFIIRARAGNIGTDYIQIVDASTGSVIAKGQSGIGSLTTSVRYVTSSNTWQEYEAELINPSTGSVDATSAPVDVAFSVSQGNGSNMGYENNTNGIMALAITGLSAPQDSQNPDLFVGWENIQGTPVDQFWIGNKTGWQGTAWEPAWGGLYADTIDPSFSGQPIGYGANGQWAVTAYVEDSSEPDAKPYLAKAHTIWFYSNVDSSSSLSFNTQNPNEGQQVQITAPSGYSSYQVWVSPQDGMGRWDSFTSTSNVIDFNPTQMGGWEIQVFAGSSEWTGYINVNQ